MDPLQQPISTNCSPTCFVVVFPLLTSSSYHKIYIFSTSNVYSARNACDAYLYSNIYCIPEKGLACQQISSEYSHGSIEGFAFWSERWFVKHDYLRNNYDGPLGVIWSAANSHAGLWCLSTYDGAAYLEGSCVLFPDAASSGVEIKRRIHG